MDRTATRCDRPGDAHAADCTTGSVRHPYLQGIRQLCTEFGSLSVAGDDFDRGWHDGATTAVALAANKAQRPNQNQGNG